MPKGIASGNGRIEAKLADVSAKGAAEDQGGPGRRGRSGPARPGAGAARREHARSRSGSRPRSAVAGAREKLAVANSAIVKAKSENELAKIEYERSKKLVAERAGSQREVDVRKMAVETTAAAVAEEEAKLESAKQDVEAAEANVATVQTRIADATSRRP